MEPTATATATDTETKAADPIVASEIEARLKDLRKLAKSDPVAAQNQTWDWIKKLGERKAEVELGELYKLGDAPKGLDGPTDGILVTPLIQPAADSVLRLLTKAWMPWQGKRFDSKNNRGDNRLTGSTRFAAKLFWPLYSTRPADDGRIAFDFETNIEPGKADPDVKVLKIDYEPEELNNPGFLIRKIRDELVQLVPDTYLGKILYRVDDGQRFVNIGYFALKQPAG
jgi:hypothetical protein